MVGPARSQAPRVATIRFSVRLAVLLGGAALLAACAGNSRGAAKPDTRVPVSMATVERKTVPYQVRAIGNVEAYSTVAVKARIGGELQQVHFEEGQEVEKGQLLFTIDPRPSHAAVMQAEAVLERDRALLAKAQADVARYAQLVKQEFVTKEQDDQAVATADSLRASVAADEAALETARLDLAYCTIRSPITGRTGNLAAKAGNLIKADDTTGMVTIKQDQPIYVTFSVPEQVLSEVRSHRSAGSLGVEAVLRQEPAKPVEGELSFVDNAVDTTTGTILLKATFPNQDGRLWPGQFVDVVLTLGEQPDAIVVPTEAVSSGQQGQYAFVVKADGTVESRPLKVDRVLAHETVVAEGLKAGERVVTDGQLRLAPGVAVTETLLGPGPAGT